MLKLACGLALVLFLSGCSSHSSSVDAKMYRMGERIQVGPLITPSSIRSGWIRSTPRVPGCRTTGSSPCG